MAGDIWPLEFHHFVNCSSRQSSENETAQSSIIVNVDRSLSEKDGEEDDSLCGDRAEIKLGSVYCFSLQFPLVSDVGASSPWLIGAVRKEAGALIRMELISAPIVCRMLMRFSLKRQPVRVSSAMIVLSSQWCAVGNQVVSLIIRLD